MASSLQLLHAFDNLLQPERFKDYGPNGLQVEGRAQVRRIVSGVTASLALIDAAIEADADALFVHHGLFWRGQDGRLTGWLRERVARLIRLNEYKRRQAPLGIRVTHRSFGKDWRYPITARFRA